MDPARKIALRLHALHADDREAILSHLDGPPRAKLENLLGDLDALGFQIDAELLVALDGAEDSGPDETADVEPLTEDERTVEAAPADLIWPALRDEPEFIRRCVLEIGPWSWAGSVQQAVAASSPRTGRDEPAEPAPRPTPRVREAVLAALVARLSEVSEAPDLEPEVSAGAVPAARQETSLRRRLQGWLLPWR